MQHSQANFGINHRIDSLRNTSSVMPARLAASFTVMMPSRTSIEADHVDITKALTDGSSWRGSLNEDNQADSASIALDRSSSWELTANSYVTSISDKDASFANIKSNGHNIYYDAS